MAVVILETSELTLFFNLSENCRSARFFCPAILKIPQKMRKMEVFKIAGQKSFANLTFSEMFIRKSKL